jgi:hypothetical protein
MEPLIHLSYKVDKQKLLQEAEKVKSSAQGYTDSRYPDMKLDGWLICRHTSEYIEQIMKDLEVEGRPRFYWLMPNEIIPEHVDNGTLCSINFVLTENASPITFNDTDYCYETILLNTTLPHSVHNNEYERIMLKISIFNETYEDLAKRIKYKNE